MPGGGYPFSLRRRTSQTLNPNSSGSSRRPRRRTSLRFGAWWIGFAVRVWVGGWGGGVGPAWREAVWFAMGAGGGGGRVGGGGGGGWGCAKPPMVHEFTRCGWPVPPRKSCRGTPGGKEGKKEVFTPRNPSNTPPGSADPKPQTPNPKPQTRNPKP